MVPTVFGDKCRLRSQWILAFPLISKIRCFLETESALNLLISFIGIYNALRKFRYLSSIEDPDIIEPSEPESVEMEELEEESDLEVNVGLDKALATYRKLTEGGKDAEPLTEEEQADLEKRLAEIQSREVIETVEEHEPVEIPCEKGKITIGPPTLTRFEKARIMGARALQLSLGAPPFIPIPKTARISLDISMEELEQRVIPITIRRVLPNGDYQNIPIDYFD